MRWKHGRCYICPSILWIIELKINKWFTCKLKIMQTKIYCIEFVPVHCTYLPFCSSIWKSKYPEDFRYPINEAEIYLINNCCCKRNTKWHNILPYQFVCYVFIILIHLHLKYSSFDQIYIKHWTVHFYISMHNIKLNYTL